MAGFLALTLAWGMAGSVFMNSSRTLFQQAAPAESRARVLSVNQLGFMAAAPVGSLVAGFASARLGPLDAMVASGTVMLLLVASVATLSGVRRMSRGSPPAGPRGSASPATARFPAGPH